MTLVDGVALAQDDTGGAALAQTKNLHYVFDGLYVT